MVSQLARWATWPCLALLAVLSLTPGPHMVRTGAPASLEHVIAYLLTGMIVAIGYGRRSMSLLALGALLSAYAGLLEIGQFWVPGRDTALLGFVASSFGAWLGTGVVGRIWAMRPSTGAELPHGAERSCWPQGARGEAQRPRRS